MEGAPSGNACGFNHSNRALITAQFATKHVARLVGHSIHDATVTIASDHPATAPTGGEWSDELLQPPAKATPTSAEPSSSYTIASDVTRRPSSPEWLESGCIVTVTVAVVAVG